MTRVARIVIPNCPHYVTQRGNNRQDVFFVDQDRETYLPMLVKESEKHRARVDGDCLMTNHVHLIAIPQSEESLARAFGRTHLGYAQYLNRLHQRSGHLWQNRFDSCALDEGHSFLDGHGLRGAKSRARPDRRLPWRYAWSSAAAHCGRAPERPELLDFDRWNARLTGSDWKETLADMLDEATVSCVRRNTHRGRPLGSNSFLSKIESLAGRRLRPLPVGRPRKNRRNR